ncbi:hypothetical protein IP510_07590 [Psychrobacter sp. NG254]|uniref:hypothetical protein n=1 Tax=Psychrobacter sp. NG254 TaxID=2782003 RepID=UPI001886B90B|nr:hypothetical protein [Psychrobacter sp. NG254]MBF2719740.1 hypothetical protein [Psychrobacter sp. NG254]
MIKFREKWFWALCLAVLVHVAVFFIFYMNMNKTDSLDVASSSINKDEPLAINSQDSSVPDKIYTTTLKSTTAPDSTGSDSGDTAVNAADRTGTDTSSRTELTSSNKETSASTSSSIEDNAQKPASTAKKTAQENDLPTQKSARQNNKLLENQLNENTQSIVTNSNETLETFRNNAGLLDIDVPTRQSNVKLDKDYLSAKSEVEEINNQLSSAINEVKKRNQQKIDNRQALRDETIIQNNQNSIESSE